MPSVHDSIGVSLVPDGSGIYAHLPEYVRNLLPSVRWLVLPFVEAMRMMRCWKALPGRCPHSAGKVAGWAGRWLRKTERMRGKAAGSCCPDRRHSRRWLWCGVNRGCVWSFLSLHWSGRLFRLCNRAMNAIDSRRYVPNLRFRLPIHSRCAHHFLAGISHLYRPSGTITVHEWWISNEVS